MLYCLISFGSSAPSGMKGIPCGVHPEPDFLDSLHWGLGLLPPRPAGILGDTHRAGAGEFADALGHMLGTFALREMASSLVVDDQDFDSHSWLYWAMGVVMNSSFLPHRMSVETLIFCGTESCSSLVACRC
ncbi:hypothetical protein MTO96_047256 [Rhipicephalus appendiculatus]